MGSPGTPLRSPRNHSGFANMKSTHPFLLETVTYLAAQALGRGFDVTNDCRLGLVKGAVGSHLVEVDDANKQDLITPTGLVIHAVPSDINLDKGERTHFKSDVLSYSQMSERFNQGASITEKFPLGLFNAMYGFSGPSQIDANATKGLALDGWFISLYCLQLTTSPLVLIDEVKMAVPINWEPNVLAGFIKKYGTHIIVGINVGGKNVIYVRQYANSNLQPADVARLMQKCADQRFETRTTSPARFAMQEGSVKEEVSDSFSRSRSVHQSNTAARNFNNTKLTSKDDVEVICRRRGGDDTVESHDDWIASVSESPDVVSMSFVPISSLLEGVAGAGFLSHAINLYLRYKPPLEELEHFLDFQFPKQWSPSSELAVGPPVKEVPCPSMQFCLMGPKLYVNTTEVAVGRKPVTGLRLILEGKKCNKLAIQLQHLSCLPRVLRSSWDAHVSVGASAWREPEERDSRWFEPVQWKNFSHICTAPVEFGESWIGEASGTFIVTGAQLQVWDFGVKKKVLFIRLLYCKVPGCSIRRSQWDNTPATTEKSGLLSVLGLSGPIHPSSPVQDKVTTPFDQNSAVFSPEPTKRAVDSKLLRFVDMSEMTKGASDLPGHWLVSGAKLHVEYGKISLRLKYSLLHYGRGPSVSMTPSGSLIT